MALREQPYIPLYVQDFLSDEKLRECSAESVGVYIMLMCVLHKQKEYGKLLLLQKDNKSPNKISNFAIKLSLHIPFNIVTIEKALQELLDEEVIQIEGDALFQKRMVKDGKLSSKRASAGKKGMKARYSDNKSESVVTDFAITKSVTNSENEIEIENKYKSDNKEGGMGGETVNIPPPPSKPKLKKYGEYQHVKLTDEQYLKLIADFGKTKAAEYIKRADEYVQQTGRKYRDFNLTIRKWIAKDGEEEKNNIRGEDASFDIAAIEEALAKRNKAKI